MEVDVEVGAAEKKSNEENDGSLWERFLPRMVLRVLLVEADDSTRQIIAALFRKCSYIVAAVPDGLMAWETLKDRPHSIDLILTEVELPSISGYALLTLVMEHDICKNIPVITDFLIKPVRRNELRNLWQHVWRRHMLAGGCSPHNLPATEHKVEATAENNDESNQSSDYGSSTEKIKDESDTQGLSQWKCMSSNISYPGREQQGNVVKLGQESLKNEGQAEGISGKQFVSENSKRFVKEVAHCSDTGESIESKLEESFVFLEGMTHDIIGLQIRAFFEKILFSEQKESRYKNRKSLQPIFPTVDGNHAALKENDNKPIRDLESSNCISEPHVITPSDSWEILPSPVKGQSDRTSSNASIGLFSVTGVRLDVGCNNVFSTRLSCTIRTGLHNWSDEATNSTVVQTARGQDKQVPVEELRCSSLVDDQSSCSHLCNDVSNHENSCVHGGGMSRGNASAIAAAINDSTTTDISSCRNCFVQDDLKRMDAHHSSQREAALTKFRKQKDQCFGKKVQYQNRKRLAEQRPRVKGQFALQVQHDTPVCNGK
ncbi:Two-component response regulator-like APRR9 [Hibiscus syriacus]|uniref:Two-component response regulator-like APRR9 n=1 Tax=Hibiscus syriacus TaxID=106335 RepID=A0A6A3A1K4_HIBSY|nr:Two-component response regulator-like APRR9 [Hibiscus syriacus]